MKQPYNIRLAVEKLEGLIAHIEKTEFPWSDVSHTKYLEDFKELHKLLSDPDIGYVAWEKNDVLERAQKRSIKITEEHARNVIEEAIYRHDCTLGITWDTLDVYLDEYQEDHLWQCNDCEQYLPEPDKNENTSLCPHCKLRRIQKVNHD